MHKFLNTGIALVWLVNGLYCKILNGVPRHRQIVARILGGGHAALLTRAIGISEVLMVIWIATRFAGRRCAIVQISVVMVMNIIEATLAPDLLLWGYGNIFFAIVFAGLVMYNERLWQRAQTIVSTQQKPL